MKSERSKGACAYCGREMTRGGMVRHLAGCDRRRVAVATADAGNGARTELVHLQVRDGYGGDYWLNLEVDAEATLGRLDGYLRRIWLECCDHLSQFSIGGWRGEPIGMARKVGRVFRPGLEITHIYDFGTSSVTLLKAVDVRAGKCTTKHPIALMARNTAPAVACQECAAPATRMCMQCIYDEDREGTLCDDHAAAHPHGDYGDPMPLVNSPRVGMCGYDGPAEPPY
jgi:hypothetical protein